MSNETSKHLRDILKQSVVVKEDQNHKKIIISKLNSKCFSFISTIKLEHKVNTAYTFKNICGIKKHKTKKKRNTLVEIFVFVLFSSLIFVIIFLFQFFFSFFFSKIISSFILKYINLNLNFFFAFLHFFHFNINILFCIFLLLLYCI